MAIETRASKKDKRPRYLVRIEIRSPDGSRKQLRVGSFTSKREAEKAEAAAITARERGSLMDPSKVTLGEVVDQWLKVKADDVNSNTIAQYSGNARVHVAPALGSVPIQRLSASILQAQYITWRESGLSPHVIRHCHLLIGQVLTFALRMNLVAHNVAKDVCPPRLPRPKFDHWNPQEAIKFLEVARTDAMWPIWDLLLREGLRRGEALGLRWRDVNWDRGTIHISQTVVPDRAQGGAAMIQSRTKTQSGARTVHLTSESLDALREHRKHWAAKQLASGEWRDLDLIICSGHGTPINPRNVARSFCRIIKVARLRPITVHQMRHTAASLMLQSGIPAKTISERLGHSSVMVTLDVYGHLAEGMQSDAALAMSRILSSGASAEQ